MAHSHDFSEIVLLADGTLTHHCENESLPLKKGDFFLVHQKMKHGYSDINEKTLCYNILYNSKVAVPMVLLSKSPFLHRLYPDSKENGLFSGILGTVTNRDLPRIVSLLRHMQSETKELRPGHQTLVISLFSTVVLLLSRHCREKITPPQRWSLDKMIGMMNDHLSDNSISMKKLASSSGMSIRVIQRRFQTFFGISPTEYLQKLRISRAISLLRNTSLTNDSIAVQCGFYNYSHMWKLFQKHLSCSPSDLRAGKNTDIDMNFFLENKEHRSD